MREEEVLGVITGAGVSKKETASSRR
jgi:hypothetical protein